MGFVHTVTRKNRTRPDGGFDDDHADVGETADVTCAKGAVYRCYCEKSTCPNNVMHATREKLQKKVSSSYLANLYYLHIRTHHLTTLLSFSSPSTGFWAKTGVVRCTVVGDGGSRAEGEWVDARTGKQPECKKGSIKPDQTPPMPSFSK